ncbi:hypothetical protein ACM25N_14550 [Roseovarius sp. C7]|uniref:hypothetical protein n=1 Tax=Roseovarius sp. C7 TaxID=3398643 RepID=UPI0039F66E66
MPTKHIHRVPVSEEFIVPIGEAICVCQYLDDGLHCIGRRLSSTFYAHNEGKTSGRLVRNLRNLVETTISDCAFKADLLALCDEADVIFRKRNEVVHSKGYTTPEGSQSRLYRSGASADYVYLNPDQIREFVKAAAAIACKANSLLHDSRMPTG